MNSVRPNNLNLKYQRFTSSDCKGIEIRQFEFVTKLNSFVEVFIGTLGPGVTQF